MQATTSKLTSLAPALNLRGKVLPKHIPHCSAPVCTASTSRVPTHIAPTKSQGTLQTGRTVRTEYPIREINRSFSMSVPSPANSHSSLVNSGGQPMSTGTSQEPTVHSTYEPVTGTWQYIVADPSTRTAAIVDSVLDYDPNTLRITTNSADALLKSVQEKNYKVQWILETHAHADHLSAASYLQKKLSEQQGHRPLVGIGKRIDQVQKLFGKRYCVPEKEYEFVFDKTFDDDEIFEIGNIKAQALHLPGHTPDHLGYRIGGRSMICNSEQP